MAHQVDKKSTNRVLNACGKIEAAGVARPAVKREADWDQLGSDDILDQVDRCNRLRRAIGHFHEDAISLDVERNRPNPRLRRGPMLALAYRLEEQARAISSMVADEKLLIND
jgi:hypothetical protein